MERCLAIDIGASSGRHIVGWLEGGQMRCQEVYRFSNGVMRQGGVLCWDYEELFAEIVRGLKRCRELAMVPTSLSVDTWGVDFVLLDHDDRMIGEPAAYRDGRTEGAADEVAALISDEELYSRTGIQKQRFNTIYQLWRMRERLGHAWAFLMAPDYLTFRLTGVKTQEYTVASTTGLLDARARTWDGELLDLLGYPRSLFTELSLPGTPVGGLRPEVVSEVGFDCPVALCASHDTASAVMSVPITQTGAVYISSGTWSLMGVENLEPITTDESRVLNLTNEGGYDYRFRYLKNITGLWIMQCLRNELGFGSHRSEDLARLARDRASRAPAIDVNDERLLAPASMVRTIQEICAEKGQAIPQTPGELLACAYCSLAQGYRNTALELERMTGRSVESIHIVGGGSLDRYLNELTARECRATVWAGPVEATATGNVLCQMLARGHLGGLSEGRKLVRDTFPLQEEHGLA